MDTAFPRAASASAFSLLLLLSCGGASGGTPAADGGDATGKEAPADSKGGKRDSTQHLPDFELETLEGGTVALSEHWGKEVILIDFWATFCDPCLVAMPHLNDLYEKYKGQGFVILGVNIDGPDSMARVRSEARKMGIKFPILLDPETEALSLYNPKTSAPYSVLINRKGEVIKKKEGFTPADVPALEKAIQAALSMSERESRKLKASNKR